jgi:hypothetical protein
VVPRVQKLCAFLASACVALLIACVVLALHARAVRRARGPDLQTAIDTPVLRDQLVRELARNTVGVFDTHNDPDVARVLQANLQGAINTGVPFHSNALGLREREFALPKPPGTLRVVLLGDSFVMGYGAEAQDRAGVFLERYLREHAVGWEGPIECLHVGIGSWNIVSACTYLRRLLSELQPDLVVHLVVSNDLDDVFGVRGFGALASFAPRTRERADSTLLHWSASFGPDRNASHLLMALDHESRSRYAEAVTEMSRLERALERIGGRYLVVGHWGGENPRLWRALQASFEPADCIFLPQSWFEDLELIFAQNDAHFRRAGHERFARILYHVIRARGLLPELALAPWPEAEGPARAEVRRAWKESTRAQGPGYWAPSRDLARSLLTDSLSSDDWRQVYCGLDAEGLVSPFAAFVLPGHGRAVHVRGQALDRPEMEGARVRVSVEEFFAGEIELVPGAPIDALIPLPAGALERDFVALTLETDDYVYAGRYRQHCVSFRLAELAVVLE